jgi:hypothetical protein
VLVEGAEHPDVTVTSGQITLNAAYTDIVVGIRYFPVVETMRIEAGAQDGVAQGKTKRIHNLTLRLNSSAPGLFIGDDDTKLKEIHFRSAGDDMDASVPLRTGDVGPNPFPGNYNQKGVIIVEHRGAGPCIIVAMYPQMKTEDRG